MGYAGERIMCDADSHIMETFDWLKEHADPELRDSIPPLKLGGAGRLAEKAIENALARRQDPSKAAELRANVIGGAKGWGAYGAFDPVELSRPKSCSERCASSGFSARSRLSDCRRLLFPARLIAFFSCRSLRLSGSIISPRADR